MPLLARLTLIVALTAFSGSGAAQVITDTSYSKFAKILPVGIGEVRWTKGFWADRVEVCHRKSVPTMWALMRDGTYKPFLEHFLIAAGKAEGAYHGAQWNDGDFYKWLEAAIATYAVTKDPEIQKAIDTSISAIAAAQREDGYIHTPVLIRQRNGDTTAKPFENRLNFEMYNMGHLITTACLHHRLTKKSDLITVAEKAAQFLIAAFSHPTPELARNSVCPSHYMAAIELYRTTRKPEYLRLAQTLLEMRDLVTDGSDDNQDLMPFTEQREAVGHAVRANYLYAGAADLYLETGDQDLLRPLTAIWENLTHKKLYITGACGALYDGASPDGSSNQESITRVHQAFGRNYQLPHTTAHNETCANIAGAMWNWRMFLFTGEARYIDLMELALYNSILSGVSLSGTEYFYVNPLRVVDPLPVELRYPRTRQKFFTSFCCPPNVVRTIAEVGGYAYCKTDDAILVNLYGSNALETNVASGKVRLTQQTNYPWDGKVRIIVDECPTERLSIKLRIPSWCTIASGKVRSPLPESGEPAFVAATDLKPNSFWVVSKEWQAGDVIELELPMPPQFIEAHPLVEETTNQIAIKRGPIVYCLESADLPEGTRVGEVTVPSAAKLAPRYAADLLGGAGVIETMATATSPPNWNRELYRPMQTATAKEIPVRLIPYYAWANRGAGEMSVWLPIK